LQLLKLWLQNIPAIKSTYKKPKIIVGQAQWKQHNSTPNPNKEKKKQTGFDQIDSERTTHNRTKREIAIPAKRENQPQATIFKMTGPQFHSPVQVFINLAHGI